MKRATRTDWRRRIRASAPRRARCLLRGGRILALLLSVSGCAVEPRPALVPPPATPPGPVVLVTPPIVSRFGEWRGEGGSPTTRHAGIDIRAISGTPVLAAADGIVIRTGSQVFAGRLVVVEHDADLATVYYHLSAVEVMTGQAVRRGQRIGRVGASGNATAPHLHFGVCRREAGLCGERIGDGWQDPTRHWIAANPCFVAGHSYARHDRRFSYPVPCLPEPAADGPAERPHGTARPARSTVRPA